eukprot:TRINITY_DN11413_c0_g5_i1.p1 TRINITY_DN11413_c0_g5~~TRINITY_DN11413_c0_g5_i1.p1  ORF type:complete len:835 (+),score=229.39 TRINITY_DN11413_c0_g5_i1:187-2691(+)
MFAKRARPAGGNAAQLRSKRRARSSSSASEGAADSTAGAAAARGGSRLSLDCDEDNGAFRVKKSKLSRQMTARGAPVQLEPTSAAPADGRRQSTAGRRPTSAPESRELLRGALATEDDGEDAPMVVDPSEVLAGPEAVAAAAAGAGEGAPGVDSDEDGDNAAAAERAAAARLARAQRAAVRELGGSKAEREAIASRAQRPQDYVPLVRPQGPAASRAVGSAELGAVELGTERSPFEKPAVLSAAPASAGPGDLAIAAAHALSIPGSEEDNAAEAWAMQQMRVGAHRRRAGAVAAEDLKNLSGAGALPAARSRAPLPHKGLNGDTGKNEAAAPKLQSPAQAMTLLWETLEQLEGGVGERSKREEELEEQRLSAQDQLKEIEGKERGLDKLLRAAQELDRMAWGLGGLLDEKVKKLRQASQTLATMEQEVAKKSRTRRSRCVAADVVHNGGATLSKASSDTGEESHLKDNRKRRRRPSTAFIEGWDTSSESEGEAQEWSRDRVLLVKAAHKQVLGDVDDEFASTDSLLEPLRTAKKQLGGEYEKAFIHESLPEALSLHVEHSLLWWDPLALPGEEEAQEEMWGPRARLAGAGVERFDWFDRVFAFTELRGDDDPDRELVPRLVQGRIFPEVARRLRECWDVSSARQTARVVELLDECTSFEDERRDSGLSELLAATQARLEAGAAELAPEVFVPNAALSRWYASDARQRLLWRSCKIAHNACQLDGRLPEASLKTFVLGHIFSTRLAPHLRAPRTDPVELALVERFVASLPASWLESGLPPALVPLRDALSPRVAPAGPQAAATAEGAAKVLRLLRCADEAQALLQSSRNAGGRGR